MSRQQADKSQEGSAESDKPRKEAAENKDSAKESPAPDSADTEQATRPDLDWAEHED